MEQLTDRSIQYRPHLNGCLKRDDCHESRDLVQPRSTGGSKLPDLGYRQSTLLRLFTGIDLQQECTCPQVPAIFDTIQMVKESAICRVDRVEEPEDGVVLVRLGATDISDGNSVTLAQGEDILPNGFLEVILTDCGSPGRPATRQYDTWARSRTSARRSAIEPTFDARSREAALCAVWRGARPPRP
jgi:hypothetical protein